MSKWKRYSVYDREGQKVLTFESKKVRKMKSIKEKEMPNAIGFQAPQHYCTCDTRTYSS